MQTHQGIGEEGRHGYGKAITGDVPVVVVNLVSARGIASGTDWLCTASSDYVVMASQQNSCINCSMNEPLSISTPLDVAALVLVRR
jgi:hypothetical protein